MILSCICGFIVEGLVLLGCFGLSALSIPVAKLYNNWCRRNHEHKCKRHANQMVELKINKQS